MIGFRRNAPGLKCPFELGWTQAPTSDRERFDHKPCIAIDLDPWCGIKTFVEPRGFRINMLEDPAYEH